MEDILYIVIPAYNEEANIEKTVRDWLAEFKGKNEKSRLVVADSFSTDRTHEILLGLQKENPAVEILSETGQFHGEKVIVLYKYALEHGADYIFQTDADGQTDPAEFNDFWMLRTTGGAVIGHRPVRGDGKDRAFVENVVCFLVRLFFGVTVPDANAPFRLMHRRLLEKYLNLLPQDYNLPNIILTAFFVRMHEFVVFKKITFKPRQGGKNSVNIPRIVKIGWNALSDFWMFRKTMQRLEKAGHNVQTV